MILVAVMPFLRPGALGAGILEVLFTLLLFSGLYGKRALVVASAFAGPALVFLWAGRFMVNTALDGIGALLLAGFLVFTATEILKYVVRARRVTSELIFGAVCVYLMMGIVGALLRHTYQTGVRGHHPGVAPGTVVFDDGGGDRPTLPRRSSLHGWWACKSHTRPRRRTNTSNHSTTKVQYRFCTAEGTVIPGRNVPKGAGEPCTGPAGLHLNLRA